jgi:hypothetical protein
MHPSRLRVHPARALWGTARRECLDNLLILSRRYLKSILLEFASHYNASRPTGPSGSPSQGRRQSEPRATAPSVVVIVWAT